MKDPCYNNVAGAFIKTNLNMIGDLMMKISSLIYTALLSLVLVACGGGGSDNSSSYSATIDNGTSKFLCNSQTAFSTCSETKDCSQCSCTSGCDQVSSFVDNSKNNTVITGTCATVASTIQVPVNGCTGNVFGSDKAIICDKAITYMATPSAGLTVAQVVINHNMTVDGGSFNGTKFRCI